MEKSYARGSLLTPSTIWLYHIEALAKIIKKKMKTNDGKNGTKGQQLKQKNKTKFSFTKIVFNP